MVKLGERDIGDGAACFVTLEAGPTHSGIESAKNLVTIAARSGADAIKFQMLDPDRLVADKKMPFTYEVLIDEETGESETITEPLYDILCRRTLTEPEWRELKCHSDSLGLVFFATVGFLDELTFLDELGCHSVKIASADVNHVPLIRAAARTGMCLQLDTGNASIGEIEAAIDVIRAEGNENIIIHHCPSGYPARLEGINLRIISTLRSMFPYPIAFSDHSPGWDMDIAAIVLGANIVEKTITQDRKTRSIEHIFSLAPPDIPKFMNVVRDTEIALGSPRRILYPEEREARLRNRRSAFLMRAARAGECLKDVPIEFRRPGFGLAPDRFEEVEQRTFREDRPEGHMVTLDDLV